jgi:uncharacterized RDD family membrane protein YckC
MVSIESPEQIRVLYRIASPFSRLLALIVDVALIYTAIYLAVILLGIFNIIHMAAGKNPLRALAGGSVLSSLSVFFIMVLDFVMQWFYFIFFEIFLNGRTPGKIIFGLRVISYSGKPLDATSVILRNFIRVFDQQASLYLGAFFSIILNKDFRRIGDLVAGTIVINEEKGGFKMPDFSLLALEKEISAGEKILGRKLGENELFVIRNFINNLDKISPEKRSDLADKLAEKIHENLQDEDEYTDSLGYIQKIYNSHKDY